MSSSSSFFTLNCTQPSLFNRLIEAIACFFPHLILKECKKGPRFYFLFLVFPKSSDTNRLLLVNKITLESLLSERGAFATIFAQWPNMGNALKFISDYSLKMNHPNSVPSPLSASLSLFLSLFLHTL